MRPAVLWDWQLDALGAAVCVVGVGWAAQSHGMQHLVHGDASVPCRGITFTADRGMMHANALPAGG
jgi:hypothetical protein